MIYTNPRQERDRIIAGLSPQATPVKERGIIFTGESVRAILAGKKTQTRRVVKPQPDLSVLQDPTTPVEFRRCPILGPYHHGRSEWGLYPSSSERNSVPIYGYECPYGGGEDRLWVRETFQLANTEASGPGDCVFRADCSVEVPGIRWASPIHMPRWASRLTLEITSVRVERVNQISHEDAIAEGVSTNPSDYSMNVNGSPATCEFISPSYAYAVVWNKIHGDGSFGRGEWVWAITFKVLPAGGAA